jgi:hypothetical protein
MRRARVLGAVVVALVTGACTAVVAPIGPPPRCEPSPRLAIIAQSVETAAYLPCIADLPPGWSFTRLEVSDAGTTISLASDRADRAVEVELVPSCNVSGATPIEPSDEGVRTYNRVETINPRFAGRTLDVFPGGCVVTTYSFERGPHVALITELTDAVSLFSRRELRQGLEAKLGVRLDP